MSDLIERVARAICVLGGDDPDFITWQSAKPRWTFCVPEAQAAVAEVLDAVAANLVAVQYDPAPYTAMKARLAAMRKEALGDE
jgi:hypothetical protein